MENSCRILFRYFMYSSGSQIKKQQDGIILVPTAVTYRNGKNNYDKRHALKEKQTKRDIARSIKNINLSYNTHLLF